MQTLQGGGTAQDSTGSWRNVWRLRCKESRGGRGGSYACGRHLLHETTEGSLPY